MTRLVFFGTPAFSVPFLKALHEEPSFEVAAVVCQPDKPAGRGNRVEMPETKLFADTVGLKVLQPSSLKKPEALESLRAVGADLYVVVAYGKIIPQDILDLPSRGSINVHPSLLPKYRGPSPMQWAIAEGEVQTGISIMLLDAGMDTGPILATESIDIDADETYGSLVRKVHQAGPRLLVQTIKRYLDGSIVPLAQNDADATITRLLERDDGHINWNAPMAEIERKSRAYDPWPGSWTTWKRHGTGKEIRLKIRKMVPSDFHAEIPPGMTTVRENQLFVDAADGTLEIKTIQPEGKGAMSAKEFLSGYSDINGDTLT